MSTGLVALILFGTLFLLFLLKMPIGFSLMISSILVMVLTGTGLEMVPKRLFTSCDSFAFMAVPFFILAGTLMSQGGISRRLCNFINSVLGRFPVVWVWFPLLPACSLQQFLVPPLLPPLLSAV